MQTEAEKSDDLNHQLNRLAKRDEYIRKKLAEAKQELSANKTCHESKMNAYQKEKFSLQSKITELQDSLQNVIMENEEYCNSLKNQLKNSEDVIEFYKVQVSKKDERYEEIQMDLAEASEVRIENQRAHQKIRDLENEVMKQEEVVKLASILKAKADKYPELERENKELQKENDHIRSLPVIKSSFSYFLVANVGGI